MIVNTSKFKNILNKSVKACSNNKLFPLSSLVGISIFGDGYCLLTSFDSVNLVNVSDIICEELPKSSADELVMNVVVQAIPLCSLISKINTDTIELKEEGECLIIKSGRNNYKFPIYYEEGEVVSFPDIRVNVVDVKVTRVNLDEFKLALKYNESCAAKTFEIPSLVNAYFGERIITSDSIRACFTNVSLFDTPVLLQYPLLKLLNIFDDEEVNVVFEGNNIAIFNDAYNTCVVGQVSDDLSEFPIVALNRLATIENNNEIRLVKKELVDCLERLAIFDDNILNVTITKNAVTFSNGDSVNEVLELTNATEFEFSVALSSFLPLIRATDGEVIHLRYGSNIGVSVVSYNEDHDEIVTRILAFIVNE